MEYVFISYASRSEVVATAIGATLEALGASCFVYQRPGPNTAVDADTLTKIKNQIESSTFFIQILDGSAGTPVNSHAGTPILQLETDWYLRIRDRLGGRRPLPHIISFPPTTTGEERRAFDRYITWLHDEGVGFEPCDNPNAAYKVAVGWFARHRYSPSEIAVIEGSLDIAVGEPAVDAAFEAALVHSVPLPQKYLYTSPVASILWSKLLASNKSKTRFLYETIDYRSANLNGVRALLAQIVDWQHTMPISIIALGCGDGKRECQLVRTISAALPHRKVRVLLVDVSKTLVAQATNCFAAASFGNDGAAPSINFALADFEHPRSIASLMRRWSGDYPCVSILLGNTLGNIDSVTFLQTIASAMKPKDLLAVEIAIAHDAERKAASEIGNSTWKAIQPQRDENFEFVCGPIRALGINPKTDRYRARTIVGEWAVQRFYSYKLSAHDMEDIHAVVGRTPIEEHNLQLVKVDTFYEDTLESMYPKSLRIVAKDIADCHKVVRDGRPSKMGFVVAERVTGGQF